MMFYHRRDEIRYKVIGAIVYTFRDHYDCLDYLGIVQK